MTHEEFLGHIRRQCELAGSQAAFARDCGISGAFLSDVLNGRRAPGDKLLRAMGFRCIVTYEPVVAEKGDAPGRKVPGKRKGNAVSAKEDPIAAYGQKGGPLPSRGGSIGAAFWRAYVHGDKRIGLLGGGSSFAGRGHTAGMRRRKVEPGLVPPPGGGLTRKAADDKSTD